MKSALLNPESVIYVSVLTFWEISLKFSLKKLDLKNVSPGSMLQTAKEAGFTTLELSADVASTFHKLPRLKNKDPFDHMLAWQAIKNECILLTKDKGFRGYEEFGLKTVW